MCPLPLLRAFLPILNIINWFMEHRTYCAVPCVNQFSGIRSIPRDWYSSTFNSHFDLTGTKLTYYRLGTRPFWPRNFRHRNLTHVTFSCANMSQEWSLNRQLSYNWWRERGNKAKGVISLHRKFASSIKRFLLSNEQNVSNTFRNENSISYFKRNHTKNLRILL